MNTDLAKEWLDIRDGESVEGIPRCEAVLAFAKFLDERGGTYNIANKLHDEIMDERDKQEDERILKAWEPRKEDKPVCEKCGCSDCPFVRIRERMIEKCQPKPEPIEEWVDPFDYDWSNDPERDFRRIAGVLVDIGKRLNAVCRRLNTLTK